MACPGTAWIEQSMAPLLFWWRVIVTALACRVRGKYRDHGRQIPWRWPMIVTIEVPGHCLWSWPSRYLGIVADDGWGWGQRRRQRLWKSAMCGDDVFVAAVTKLLSEAIVFEQLQTQVKCDFCPFLHVDRMTDYGGKLNVHLAAHGVSTVNSRLPLFPGWRLSSKLNHARIFVRYRHSFIHKPLAAESGFVRSRDGFVYGYTTATGGWQWMWLLYCEIACPDSKGVSLLGVAEANAILGPGSRTVSSCMRICFIKKSPLNLFAQLLLNILWNPQDT